MGGATVAYLLWSVVASAGADISSRIVRIIDSSLVHLLLTWSFSIFRVLVVLVSPVLPMIIACIIHTSCGIHLAKASVVGIRILNFN